MRLDGNLLFRSSSTHCGQRPSVATAVFPTRLPPLFPFCTIEDWLAQPAIDVVMRIAQPLGELLLARGLNRGLVRVATEVLGAHPTRVELGE